MKSTSSRSAERRGAARVAVSLEGAAFLRGY
jgi:hypothetical protein